MKQFKLLLALAWFAITVFLLCLPGSDLPKVSWTDSIPLFDKWVHIGLFAVLVWLCCRASTVYTSANLSHRFLMICIYAIVYGIVMEFVQKYFIPFRSFDVWDILADAIGAYIGYLYSIRVYIKK